MSRRMITVIVVMIFILKFGIFSEKAFGQTVIRRNQQQTGWFLDPGKNRLFIYYPDGRTAQLTWNNNWYYWWRNSPFTTINIYSWLPRSRHWVLIHSASVDPSQQRLNLIVQDRRSPYLIVVRNYRGGDILTLRVR